MNKFGKGAEVLVIAGYVIEEIDRPAVGESAQEIKKTSDMEIKSYPPRYFQQGSDTVTKRTNCRTSKTPHHNSTTPTKSFVSEHSAEIHIASIVIPEKWVTCVY